MFISMAKVDIVHVPYKGTVPGLTDLLGAHVDLFFVGIPPTLPHIKAGKLRALGVGTQERLASLPDVPTIMEAGVPGYEVVSFFGVVVPAKTPEAIVNKLNAKIIEIINRPAIKKALTARGLCRGAALPPSSRTGSRLPSTNGSALSWRPRSRSGEGFSRLRVLMRFTSQRL